MPTYGICAHLEMPDDIECEFCNAYSDCPLHAIRHAVVVNGDFDTCPACEGTKAIWTEEKVILCPFCDGRGKLLKSLKG